MHIIKRKTIWKDYILYDPNYMTFWKRQNYGDSKNGIFSAHSLLEVSQVLYILPLFLSLMHLFFGHAVARRISVWWNPLFLPFFFSPILKDWDPPQVSVLNCLPLCTFSFGDLIYSWLDSIIPQALIECLINWGTWLKPLVTVRDEGVMRPALKEETDKVAIQCWGWRKPWMKKEHLEEIKEGLEGFLEEAAWVDCCQVHEQWARWRRWEENSGGRNNKYKGMEPRGISGRIEKLGVECKGWRERQSLRLAPQAAIWTADSLGSLGWTREKTFLEHNFRDVSLQCERVGVVEQATH